jgi:nucleotide-binding universal stress UspA family protein
MLIVRAQPKTPRPPELPDYEEGLYDRLLSEDKQRGIRVLEKGAAELAEALGARPEVRLLIDDEATAAILAASEEVVSTLVAVGAGGLGPVGRGRLGSVSTKVLNAAGYSPAPPRPRPLGVFPLEVFRERVVGVLLG